MVIKDSAITGNERGHTSSGASSCTPGRGSKRRQAACKVWKQLHIISYNTGSLSELRTHQIIREFEQEHVSGAIILGTRNPFSGERVVGNFRLYYEGSGESTVDMHAGVIIAVQNKFVTGSRITKLPASPHRSLALRIKTEFIDVTLVSGYAPGDHLPRKLRQPFWRQLEQFLRQLPKRTIKILGIDANGHIGRDGTGMVGIAGAERWTENGHALHDLAETTEMTVLNTRNNCAEPGWTWQRSDGKGKGRIDYLLVSNSRTGQVTVNSGAVDWVGLEREGSTVDHRPVQAVFNFKLLDMNRSNQENSRKAGQMSHFNAALTNTFEAYRTDMANQYTLNRKPVNQEHLDTAAQMSNSFQQDIRESWDSSDDVDTKVEKLDRAATNVYNAFCRKSQTVVKQKHMTPELVQEVCVRATKSVKRSKDWARCQICSGGKKL